jgi:hypothetical protein
MPTAVSADAAGKKASCPKSGEKLLVPTPIRVNAADKSPDSFVAPTPPVSQIASTDEIPNPVKLAASNEPAVQARYKPTTDKSEPSYPGGTGSGLMAFGVLLCIVGCLITLVYWLIYDTTVGYESTHNLGLMNNRVVGTIVGVGMALGGLIVSLGSELLASITLPKILTDTLPKILTEE